MLRLTLIVIICNHGENISSNRQKDLFMQIFQYISDYIYQVFVIEVSLTLQEFADLSKMNEGEAI